MIAALAFGAPVVDARGRTIRSSAFVARSSLPLSAACLVANGVREALARSLACDVDVELFEPSLPAVDARRTLLAGAIVRRVRGKLGDAFVVVRGADAVRLVARAFGETERAPAEFSAIERATFERIVDALAPLCSALVGPLGAVANETVDRALCDLTTYFEVRALGAQPFAIGFGLANDPDEDVGAKIAIEDLGEVELRGVVHLGAGRLPVTNFSHLDAGTNVLLDGSLDDAGTLCFGSIAFAHVRCGERGGKRAFVVAERAA